MAVQICQKRTLRQDKFCVCKFRLMYILKSQSVLHVTQKIIYLENRLAYKQDFCLNSPATIICKSQNYFISNLLIMFEGRILNVRGNFTAACNLHNIKQWYFAHEDLSIQMLTMTSQSSVELLCRPKNYSMSIRIVN